MPWLRDAQPDLLPRIDGQEADEIGAAIQNVQLRIRNGSYLPQAGARVECGFGTEAVQFLRLLALHGAAAVPRPPGSRDVLAVAAQHAFAASLLELPPAADLGDGLEPELHELLAEAR